MTDALPAHTVASGADERTSSSIAPGLASLQLFLELDWTACHLNQTWAALSSPLHIGSAEGGKCGGGMQTGIA